MDPIEWEREWHTEEGDLPPLGALIQLKIAHIATVETRVCQGIVSEVNDLGQIELIPSFEEDASEWGWAMWRARVVPLGNIEEVFRERELNDV